ncbi:septum formation initiator family protein [Geothrix sp. 21YS21S-2]|uniref:FtsB family cell division protein n=1 Tax=Geothrix sp. 21YS21S-2 TaxID=3068893 RepID=UPI0027B97535|nr:septum formation initiator family protein [Geothrix sp. 21YS21S-2]
MNTSLLLKSSTLWGVLAFSGLASTGILLFSPSGIGSLHKRQAELLDQQRQLLKMRRANLELGEEVKRLAARDPELYEALARQQGLARPGETIYTFRERGARR